MKKKYNKKAEPRHPGCSYQDLAVLFIIKFGNS